eukprot:TRINITY_DN2228_c0_g1_i1.p1 TRINITY_DN2228_c0_g1~~TRINITY_DN2228_c0_g1_i1.p1  ORF type:complete len:227 (+),score=59.36 TRINITY_DN2228_c0_g1_i1:11-691(+)
MTCAARPTFDPAVGGNNQGGNRLIAPTKNVPTRSLPAHTVLKVRQPGQGTSTEIEKKDLKAELLRKEREHLLKVGRLTQDDLLRLEDGDADIQDSKDDANSDEDMDADDTDSSDSDNSGDDSDSSDDEMELFRELKRIKEEREQKRKKRKREIEETEKIEAEEAVMFTNPTINQDRNPTSQNVRKQWYADSIFNNQTRDEPARKKRFINDTMRNDFHKKFLHKYIK